MTQMILDGFAENSNSLKVHEMIFLKVAFLVFLFTNKSKFINQKFGLRHVKTSGFPFSYKQPVQNCSKPVNIVRINPRSVKMASVWWLIWSRCYANSKSGVTILSQIGGQGHPTPTPQPQPPHTQTSRMLIFFPFLLDYHYHRQMDRPTKRLKNLSCSCSPATKNGPKIAYWA